MRTLTLVETGNFKMVRDILRTIKLASKANQGNLGPMLLYALVTTKKGQERVLKDLTTIENVTFNANQNACSLGVLFNFPLEGVVGACEKLRDFFVQYLKF